MIRSIAILAACSGLASGQNLLNNAGFESPLGFDFSNLSNWNGFFGGPAGTFLEAFNNTGAPAFSGAQALELTIEGVAGVTNGNEAFTGHVQFVDGIQGGAAYDLSVWARNNASNLDGVFEFRVEWRNAADMEISRQQIEISGDLTDAYQQFAFQATAPTDAVRALIVLGVATGADEGFVYNHSVLADDVNFSLVPTPATMALLGLGGLAATRRRR